MSTQFKNACRAGAAVVLAYFAAESRRLQQGNRRHARAGGGGCPAGFSRRPGYGKQQCARVRAFYHRVRRSGASRRPACRSVCGSPVRPQGERRSGPPRGSARASRPERHPRQPDGRRGFSARCLAGLRTGGASIPAHDQVARDRHGRDAAARGRRDSAQQRAKRASCGAHTRGHRAPATGAYRSACTVRRNCQRAEGFRR